MTTISFLHSGDMGDIIASLATVKEICEKENARAEVVLDPSGGRELPEESLSREFIMRQSNGKGNKFNKANVEFLSPLLEAQPYIASVTEYTPEKKIDFDLNLFRRCFFDMDLALKSRTNLLFSHQIIFDLKPHYEPWLTVTPSETSHDIIIARTSRYQSAHVFFASMEKEFSEKGEFIGTDFEYDLYLNAFGYRPPRLPIADAWQAACAIANSNAFVSNGTVFYWIALGLGHPRIVHELGIDIQTTLFTIPEPRVFFVKGATCKTWNPDLGKEKKSIF